MRLENIAQRIENHAESHASNDCKRNSDEIWRISQAIGRTKIY